MAAKILVVDDEALLSWSVQRKLQEWGYECVGAGDCAQALQRLRSEPFDLVLLDIRLPDGSGVDVLQQMRSESFTIPVIMITADPKFDDVKLAMRLGAYDFLEKPINFDGLHVNIVNALEATQLRQEVATLRDEARRRIGRLEMIGSAPATQQLLAFARRVATSETTAVLLQGESGTGKDLLAQIIHQNSPRSEAPFVPVNCSAIPENLLEAELFGYEKGAFTDAKAAKKGLFEMANGGTIFLDEIGELPLALQSKLLRTLENQTLRRLGGLRDITLNVRVIAASNRNLEAEVRRGGFRQDLFYRLMVIPIFIPPLRSRREDIPALATFFIEQYNRRFGKRVEGLEPAALAAMRAYDWPGNIRELKNAVQRAMILEDGSLIAVHNLPFGPAATISAATAFPDLGPAAAAAPGATLPLPGGRSLPAMNLPPNGTSLDAVELYLLREALRVTDGNQSQAARLLDISRDRLRYAMKKHGLDHVEAR